MLNTDLSFFCHISNVSLYACVHGLCIFVPVISASVFAYVHASVYMKKHLLLSVRAYELYERLVNEITGRESMDMGVYDDVKVSLLMMVMVINYCCLTVCPAFCCSLTSFRHQCCQADKTTTALQCSTCLL